MLKKSTQDSNIDVDLLLSNLKEKFDLKDSDLKELTDLSQITIPITIFKKNLGCLESIVLYLKDDKKLGFNSIAKMLHREYQTIWSTYNKAKKKTNGKKR